MNELNKYPAPLTPPDCDLRGNAWMPLCGHQLFRSTFWSKARRNPKAGLAAIQLFWEAFMQCPAASLPDDDFDLAQLAGFGEDKKAWRAVKEIALHGFIKCSDGRLYHPFLAREAVKSFELRLKADARRAKDLERLRAWRARKAERSLVYSDMSYVAKDDTQRETHFITISEPITSGVDKTRHDKAVTKAGEDTSSIGGRQRICRSDPPHRWAALAETWELDDKMVKRPVVKGEYIDVFCNLVLVAAGVTDPHWCGDYRPVVAWLRAGIESSTILFAIRHVAARPNYRPPTSLAYFDRPVRDCKGP